MTNTIQRQAKTRRDSGELTRDQRRERERSASQPAPELAPGQWQHRGVQPAVIVPPKTGFARLMELAAEIREEFDPVAKAVLEARYRQEAVAAADLTLDPRERHLRETCAEVVGLFAVGADSVAEPECWSRSEWLAFHKRILVCRRRSMQWLTVSRHFAAERWGAGFVTAAEASPPPAPAPASP